MAKTGREIEAYGARDEPVVERLSPTRVWVVLVEIVNSGAAADHQNVLFVQAAQRLPNADLLSRRQLWHDGHVGHRHVAAGEKMLQHRPRAVVQAALRVERRPSHN